MRACTSVKLGLENHAEECCANNTTSVEKYLKNPSTSIMCIQCSMSVSVRTKIQVLILLLLFGKKVVRVHPYSKHLLGALPVRVER